MARVSSIFLLFFVSISLIGTSVYAQRNTYSQAQLGKINYAKKVLKEATEKNDSLQMAEAYYLFGKIESNAGNYLASQKWFMRSLSIQEKYGESFKLGRLYIRLQDNELAQGHSPEGFKYLKIASDIFKRIKSDSGLVRTYGGLASYYANAGSFKHFKNPVAGIKFNYDSALYYYNKSRVYLIKLKDTLGLAELNGSLGILHERQGDLKSLDYYKQAIAIFEQKDKKNLLAHTLINLASAYLTFNQPKEAYIMIARAQSLYDQYLRNEYIMQWSLANIYVRYYENIEDWQKVAVYLKQKHEFEKNDLSADYKGAVSRLNIEFETQKKEAKLNQQQHDLSLQTANARIQQRFLIALALLLLITIALSYVFFRLYRKNQRISKRNEVLVHEQNHRVKNNLQVVSSLLNLQTKRLSDTTARQAVEASMLRIEAMAILHRKLYDQDELVMVKLADYLMELTEEVLKTFDCADIEPNYDIVDTKLSADQAMAIGLIVTELVTNACKYAFQGNDQPTLHIKSFFDKETLVLTVKDNGSGFLPKQITGKAKSFGMRLIEIQTRQLYGTYTFESDGGSIFTMRFKPQSSDEFIKHTNN